MLFPFLRGFSFLNLDELVSYFLDYLFLIFLSKNGLASYFLWQPFYNYCYSYSEFIREKVVLPKSFMVAEP